MTGQFRNRTILPLALFLIIAGGFGSVQVIRLYGGTVNRLNLSLEILSSVTDVRSKVLVIEVASRSQVEGAVAQQKSWLARYDSAFQDKVSHLVGLLKKAERSLQNSQDLLVFSKQSLSSEMQSQQELSKRFLGVSQNLDQIELFESQMVQQYNEFISRYAQLFITLILLTSLGSVSLLALFWYLLNRENEIRNRTELKLRQAREAAVAASKMKSQFLATVSHEIRTPLNGIIGLTDLLTRRELPDAERKIVETLHRSGMSLIRIVNDILDFSKIEAGRFNLEFSSINILSWAESSFALYREKAINKGLDFSVQVSAGTPEVWIGDPVRLSQVLNNLISNAIKFTDKGKVEVRIRSQVIGSEELYVEVEDEGPGMNDLQMAQLFQPFNQVHIKTAEREESTGLGLSIAKSLLDKMHGEIGVSSEVNRGSLFWFRVPLEKASYARVKGITYSALSSQNSFSAPYSTQEESSLHLSGVAQILIAEDNLTNQFLLQEMVKEIGGAPTIVGNGQLAIEAYKAEKKWDLVIMDVRMPVVDGLMATREIRRYEESKGKHTPIIALTANARPQDKEQCLASGMDDFLSKPVVKNDLEKIIKKWIFKNKKDDFHERVMSKVRVVFKDTLPETLNQIRNYKNFQELGFVAHRLRSSAAMLGYNQLAGYCEKVERATGLDGQVPVDQVESVKQLVQEIIIEGKKVVAEGSIN